MIVSIALLQEPFFDITTELDGTSYLLSIRYNSREERYMLSISTPDGEEIAKGAALVCDWKLFSNVADDRLPPGMLMVTASGPDNSPPKLGELGFGLRCELVYIEAVELA